MEPRWEELKATAFAAVAKNDFEDLCGDLLRFEVGKRHATGAVDWVEGPLPPDVPDGGRDFLFSVQQPPRTTADAFSQELGVAPLTSDDNRSAYSCKTGATWRKKALEEAVAGRPRIVDVLKTGGSFVLLTNQQPPSPGKGAPTSDKQALVDELATAYAAHTGAAVDVLRTKIRVLDANDLRYYMGRLQPPLRQYARLLGLHASASLLNLDDWQQDHRRDRAPAPAHFEAKSRAKLLAQIVDSVKAEPADPFARALWVVGAPGIGKTRLVLEALSDPSLRARVRVALSVEIGVKAILGDELFLNCPDAILVVDDVPVRAVPDLERFVASMKSPSTAMIILTPHAPTADEVGRSPLRRIEVGPLDREDTENIIRAELGPAADAAVIEHVAKLSSGFPWFAVLVAREMAGGAAPPKDVADAAKLVLASPRDGDWEDAYILHARALLAALLTDDRSWELLSAEDRDSLCAAVGAHSWEVLEDAFRRCFRRGLLRLRAAFKYITPGVLEREVIRLLFFTPPPPRHPLLADRLGPWGNRFFERADVLLTPMERERIAKSLLGAVSAPSRGIAAIEESSLSQHASLMLVARAAPRELGSILCDTIDATSLDELREDHTLRRDLVWALALIAHRPGGFELAERALFRLALAENEAYGNNATGTWTSLFLCGVNVTRSPWPERFARLVMRASSELRDGRMLVLTGITRSLATYGMLLDHDPDAPPQPVDGETDREGRRELWRLLMRLTHDANADVRLHAQQLAAQEVRGAFHQGLADVVYEIIVPELTSFGESSLRDLREKLEEIDTYDAEVLDAHPMGARARAALEAAVAPRNFSERLKQDVWSWGPARKLDEHAAMDRTIAQEGLALPGRPLLAHLDWLLSPEAKRNVSFFIALGAADRDRVIVGELVKRARAGSPEAAAMLAAYCRGMADAGQGDEVDNLTSMWSADPTLASVATLVLARVGGNDRRAAAIAGNIRRRTIPSDASLTWLATGKWGEDLSIAPLFDVVDALIEHGSAEGAYTAVDLLVDRLKSGKDDSSSNDFVGRLIRAMEGLADEPLGGMAAYAWELGGLSLIDLGRADVACRLALRSVGRRAGGEPRSKHHWRLVQLCQQRANTELWSELAQLLQREGPEPTRLAAELRWHGIEAFPDRPMLDWIDHDAHRAALVAQFVSVRGDQLPVVARELIVRFGAEGRPARILASAAQTTYRAVSSLADFFRARLAEARSWQSDQDADVRQWAAALASDLEREVEVHAAEEEYERRRFGT